MRQQFFLDRDKRRLPARRIRRKRKSLFAILQAQQPPRRSLRERSVKLVERIRQRALLLVKDEREQQLAILSDVETDLEKSEEIAEINRHLKGMSVALGFTVGGALVYPPLTLLSIPCLMPFTWDTCKLAYQQIGKERRFGVAVLDSIALTALLLSGNFFLTAASGLLITAARKLRIKTKVRSENSIRSVFANRESTVWVWRDGVEVQMPFEAISVGDTVVVDAGQMIPIDGSVIDGSGAVDQQLLTGEAQPVEKGVGHEVFASTFVIQGRLFVRVEKMGAETVAAQVGEILLQTTAYKSTVQAETEATVEQAAAGLLGLSLLALPVAGVASAIAILNAPIVDPLRMSAPLNLLTYLQIASKQGILVKDGKSLELLSGIDTVVFDKTGTLTVEQPVVGGVHVSGWLREEDVLGLAASVEQKQAHPIARAIVQAAIERGINVATAEQVEYDIGLGIQATVNGKHVLVGSDKLMAQHGVSISDELQTMQTNANQRGQSLVFVVVNDRLAGAIEIHPAIRPESRAVIRALQERGISVVIISGDKQAATQHLATQLGIDTFYAETLPEQKAQLIVDMQQAGKAVCYIGDGINDSIALKQANVSVSLQGASAIAVDTAEIILMDENLTQLIELFDLAQRYRTNVRRIFTTSVAPGVLVIAGAFIFHFGIASTIVAYNVAMAAGVGSAMLPLLRGDRRANN